MRKRLGMWVELLIVSINYVVISYALSNLSIPLRRSWLSILFFASDSWVTWAYWNRIRELTGRRVLAVLLTVVSVNLKMFRLALPAQQRLLLANSSTMPELLQQHRSRRI